MSLMWLIIIGVVASAAAKLLIPEQSAGGLFVLGMGGSFIVGTIQYSHGNAIGLFAPMVGAILLIAAHVLISRRPAASAADHEDYRRAA